MSIQFKDPPPVSGRYADTYDYDSIRESLEAHPMQWATISEKPVRVSQVSSIKQGGNSRLQPEHGIEVTMRDVTEGPGRTCIAFLRYNPHSDTRLKSKEADAVMVQARKEGRA